jgi:hypothetical protein
MTKIDGTMATRDVIGVARELFEEAYEGARESGSWFVTPAPDAGLFATIAPLDAERASRPSRPGGPTIASHVEHLRWTLAQVNATLRGEGWQPDWSASWTVREVDEAAWNDVRAELRREFDALRARLQELTRVEDPMQLRGILALAPHAAYHLGALRQIAASI